MSAEIITQDQTTMFQTLREIYSTPYYDSRYAIELLSTAKDLNALDPEHPQGSFMHYAITARDYQTVDFLLSQGVNLKVRNQINDFLTHTLAGITPKDEEEEDNIRRLTSILLDNGVSTLRKNSYELTAYLIAATAINVPFLEVLMERQVRMGVADPRGNTLLHLLAQKGCVIEQKIKQIQNQQQLNIQNQVIDIEPDPLPALRKQATDLITLATALVDYSVATDVCNLAEKTAAEIASKMEDGHLCLVLQGDYDQNDDQLELKIAAKGMTLGQAINALHARIPWEKDFSAEMATIKAVIALGAEVNETTPETKHMPPLAIACQLMLSPGVCALAGRQLYEVLLEAGADPNFTSGENDKAVIFWLIVACKSARAMKDFATALQMLVASGLNINAAVDEEGNSAIGCAYDFRYADGYADDRNMHSDLIVSCLLAQGADINQANFKGVTPLMQFARNRNALIEDPLYEMLEHGAQIATVDGEGENALMKAACNPDHKASVQIAQILAEFDQLDFDAVNNAGATALDLAINHNNHLLVQWLSEN